MKAMEQLSDQTDCAVRFEWGKRGFETLASGGASAFVVVDVLSFSTCVTIGVDRDAIVFPYRWLDERAAAYAIERDAVLARSRGETGAEYTVSPASLQNVAAGVRLILPSPDGAELSFEAAARGVVIAGSLRNRSAVGAFLDKHGGAAVVIATGDCGNDGSLFPCIEDIVGAGAIIAASTGRRSPQAKAALAAYNNVRSNVGYASDVEIAADVDSSTCVPILRGECFAPA
jgi:2-phosphosulfolactate phosphatase